MFRRLWAIHLLQTAASSFSGRANLSTRYNEPVLDYATSLIFGTWQALRLKRPPTAAPFGDYDIQAKFAFVDVLFLVVEANT